MPQSKLNPTTLGGQSPTERQRIANGFSGGQRSRTAENFWVLLEG
jgi:hypothetical protein